MLAIIIQNRTWLTDMAIKPGSDPLNPQKKNKEIIQGEVGLEIVDAVGGEQCKVTSSTYQYRDIEKRREYQRDLMRERRKE